MPSKKTDDQKLADRANELYWGSKQSVNQIAEAMDLSKSGLYALIQPLPTGGTCPECGEALVFTNRTTEHKAIGSCPQCGYVTTESTPSAQPERAPKTELDIGASGPAVRKPNGRGGLRLSRKVWASVLLGVAAGLYVTRRSR
jgi:rubredoxin